jgi:hypothetical protein
MHGILTLHEQIHTGDLMKRRDQSGRGAEIHVDQRDGVPVALSSS